MYALTWELPRFASMEIDFHQRPLRDPLIVGHLLVEIVADQLLVAREEPEPWRQRRLDLPQRHPNYVCALNKQPTIGLNNRLDIWLCDDR